MKNDRNKQKKKQTKEKLKVIGKGVAKGLTAFSWIFTAIGLPLTIYSCSQVKKDDKTEEVEKLENVNDRNAIQVSDFATNGVYRTTINWQVPTIVGSFSTQLNYPIFTIDSLIWDIDYRYGNGMTTNTLGYQRAQSGFNNIQEGGVYFINGGGKQILIVYNDLCHFLEIGFNGSFTYRVKDYQSAIEIEEGTWLNYTIMVKSPTNVEPLPPLYESEVISYPGYYDLDYTGYDPQWDKSYFRIDKIKGQALYYVSYETIEVQRFIEYRYNWRTNYGWPLDIIIDGILVAHNEESRIMVGRADAWSYNFYSEGSYNPLNFASYENFTPYNTDIRRFVQFENIEAIHVKKTLSELGGIRPTDDDETKINALMTKFPDYFLPQTQWEGIGVYKAFDMDTKYDFMFKKIVYTYDKYGVGVFNTTTATAIDFYIVPTDIRAVGDNDSVTLVNGWKWQISGGLQAHVTHTTFTDISGSYTKCQIKGGISTQPYSFDGGNVGDDDNINGSLMDILALFGTAFGFFATFFGFMVVPGISLGALLFLPLLVIIIIGVIKLVRG